MNTLSTQRNNPELSISGQHLGVNELRTYNTCKMSTYLIKNPLQAKVKLYIAKLQHVTTKTGLNGIIEEGFKGFPKPDSQGPCFSYWSGVADSDDVEKQIRQWLAQYPSIEENDENVKSFMNSTAFSEDSRYGNYKFMFKFNDIIRAYKDQICDGKDPVFRIFGTFCYRKEIVYMIVVHSPDTQDFNNLAYLPTDEGAHICCKDNDGMFWCPEAMSESCLYEWVEGGGITRSPSPQFFVWDHVVFAFHGKSNLKFDKAYLCQHLTACDLGKVRLCGEPETKHQAEEYIKTLK